MNTKELQSIVNPVYTTAKGLTDLLIAGRDPDALKFAPYLNTSDIPRDKIKEKPPEEMVKCFMIGQMTRYELFNTIALGCGKQTIVDLPCGYSPRCFRIADNGQKYYGLDLPVVIDDMNNITSKLLTDKQKESVKYIPVDATNYDSMRNALKDVKGEICIITEGLLPYLSDNELSTTFKAFHKLLSEFGGCWITADGGGSNDIYPITLCTLLQGDKEKMYGLIQKITSTMSNVQAHSSSFSANKGEKAKEIIEKHGFIVNEESASKYLKKLKCYPEGKEDALIGAYSTIKIWTLTVDKKDEITNNEEKFNMDFNLTLNLNITGRLDTLTAPELLKKFKETQGIKCIKIDASKMTYISSAGCRVLNMMLKELENKDMLEITGANEDIKEILKTNGLEANIK